MIRGTTPNIIFTIKNDSVDLSSMKQIWVTFKRQLIEITYAMDDLEIDVDNKTITVNMSQEDTLKFHHGLVDAQIRFLSYDGNSYATKIVKLEMDQVLKEGVIE